jgi:hypothetical protein
MALIHDFEKLTWSVVETREALTTASRRGVAIVEYPVASEIPKASDMTVRGGAQVPFISEIHKASDTARWINMRQGCVDFARIKRSCD